MAGKRLENCILPVLPFRIKPVWKVCLHLTLNTYLYNQVTYMTSQDARKVGGPFWTRHDSPVLARNTIQKVSGATIPYGKVRYGMVWYA